MCEEFTHLYSPHCPRVLPAISSILPPGFQNDIFLPALLMSSGEEMFHLSEWRKCCPTAVPPLAHPNWALPVSSNFSSLLLSDLPPLLAGLQSQYLLMETDLVLLSYRRKRSVQYSWEMHCETPSGCLKSQMVPNPVHFTLGSITFHTHEFQQPHV